MSRYLRVRARHHGAELPELWLAVRGGQALSDNGVQLMLQRRGDRAGVPGLHAHRWPTTTAPVPPPNEPAHASEEVTDTYYIAKPVLAPDVSDILEQLGADQRPSNGASGEASRPKRVG